MVLVTKGVVMATKHAYEVEPGNVILGLVLDPPGDLVVDYVYHDDENDLVKVEGYIEDNGEAFSFIWGAEKRITVR